ncbi:ribonuclease H [Bifidobacterium italicum]|uniref:ribonuclease H n=1 Tax=Bifidobacterium italicum TaxID=1960968 RepID=A0A2A2EDR8_9BIFI|nr:ribonuclease H [Bifidobacterium italicum]PAU67359.1 ribonuclease H [Bifidobacterium italicum]
MTITVSTDGSALGNPNGPMGWAWADHPTHETRGHDHTGDCDAGGATNGTNQIGELCAVLEALRTHPGDEELVIETDSQYAINCSTKWVHGWKRNGWRNSKKEPVKNAELIRAIDDEIRRREGPVRFVWVKGHAGNAGNEKVDELARTYAGDCRSSVRDGYLPKEGWQSLIASSYARGLDVPLDARMLLDGELSQADYRRARCIGGQGDPDGPKAVDDDGIVDTDERAVRDADAASARAGIDDARSAVQDADGAHDAPSAHDDVTPTEESTAHDTAQPAHFAQSAQPTSSSPADEARTASPEPLLRHSGLHVHGTVTFTPPPSSSPHYDGRPRAIRGYIEVEGTVDGDGTITLDGAPFLVHRPR